MNVKESDQIIPGAAAALSELSAQLTWANYIREWCNSTRLSWLPDPHTFAAASSWERLISLVMEWEKQNRNKKRGQIEWRRDLRGECQMRQSNLTRQTIVLFIFRQTDSYAPGAPQSQHTSFPGMRSTSSIMALVRSSSPSSPPPCSPLKAMLSASSLLLVNTEIHL